MTSMLVTISTPTDDGKFGGGDGIGQGIVSHGWRFPLPGANGFSTRRCYLKYQLNAIVPNANMVVLGKIPPRIGAVRPFLVFF
ncbi:MAG: hypothetical protein H6Q41_4796 [Deltaproteobacteria bacterium]|nr:hypothetical protein [Deltaproteobacteria bacterium]